MKPASHPGKPADNPRLTRDDWLDAAFGAVVDGGFEQLRVLALADTLGVTRGSFYWHFADHAALVTALVARWQQREMAAAAALAAPAVDDPRRDLELLLASALAHAGADLENLRFELALRALGRRDAAVAALLAEVDDRRLELFRDKFRRYTGDAGKSADLAALFYLAVVGGQQALARPTNTPQTRAYIEQVIGRFLIRDHGPAAAPPAKAHDSGS